MEESIRYSSGRTSDNPRFEEPQDIINDIKTGIAKTDGKYVEICDRKEAIKYAIEHGVYKKKSSTQVYL